jgi:hypothetical protein
LWVARATVRGLRFLFDFGQQRRFYGSATNVHNAFSRIESSIPRSPPLWHWSRFSTSGRPWGLLLWLRESRGFHPPRNEGRMSARVAALFVEAGGVYFGRDDVDPWDITRDARKYAGPLPVVAHPPCQLWGAFAKINFQRWGGEHNRPGNDGGCFLSALISVRLFGGVLEHPANSAAFEKFGLQRPPCGGRWKMIRSNEWVCEVCQSNYGHRAMKKTWLFYRGNVQPPELIWGNKPGTHQCGFHDQRGKDRNKPTLGRKEANRTPPAFAELLISIAKSATPGAPSCP